MVEHDDWILKKSAFIDLATFIWSEGDSTSAYNDSVHLLIHRIWVVLNSIPIGIKEIIANTRSVDMWFQILLTKKSNTRNFKTYLHRKWNRRMARITKRRNQRIHHNWDISNQQIQIDNFQASVLTSWWVGYCQTELQNQN